MRSSDLTLELACRGEGANSDAIRGAAPVRDATSWEKVRCMLQKHSRARGGLLAAAAWRAAALGTFPLALWGSAGAPEGDVARRRLGGFLIPSSPQAGQASEESLPHAG